MIKEVNRHLILGAILVIFLSCFSFGQSFAKANIIGFLYAADGTTPVEGAVVKVKNVSSGMVFESSRSDKNGIFRIEGVEKGVYLYGIVTPEGNFISEDLVGIRVSENETAKLSISLKPYSPEVASTIQEVYKEQLANGEALVGKVTDYNAEKALAEVYILKGSLEVQDRIHTRGQQTDFYQNVKVLLNQGLPARRVFAGQTASLEVKRKVQEGDLVYLVQKRGILPFFLSPLGIASVLAGSGAIVYSIVRLNDEPCAVSPFKR